MKKFSILKGFTLIELLVVITVIGILAGSLLIVINPVEQLKKSRDAQRKHDLSQVQKALETYDNDQGHYPASIAWGGSWPGYMEVVPQDPQSGQPQYVYQVSSDGSSYRLFATLERCSDAQVMSCGQSDNYSVVSSNLSPASDTTLFPDSVQVVATATPAQGTTPNPTATTTPAATSTPTSTPTPTNTPTPTPGGFKYVFVTSANYNTDLKTAGGGATGVDGADKICKTLADASGSVTAVKNKIWQAWLSDGIQSPATRTWWQGAYRLVNGTTVVANNWQDLTDYSIQNPINIDERGNTLSSGYVATGSYSNGAMNANNCDGWTSPTASAGMMGYLAYDDYTWGGANASGGGANFGCSGSSVHIYCFQQ